ncbi:MAG: alpha/beta fold hydrolase [Clostridia bacterium]|nr:alpha/beta fold hydrolase [Clostridia bacterium]
MKLLGARIDKTAANKEWGFTELSRPQFHKGEGDIGVLICHGFGGTPANMLCLFDAAKDMGFTVGMPLLTGHAATLGDLERASLASWRTDVDNALLWLVESGCRRVFLCGLSMGALLMADLAERTAENGVVCGMTLICPPIKMKGYLGLMSALAPAMPFLLTADSFAGTGTEIYCGTATRRLADLKTLSKDVCRRLDSITVPTLLIEAEDDNRVDPVSYDILTSRIPSAEYQMIHGAPHGIPYSDKKDELTRVFAAYLNRIAEKQ